MRLLLLTLLLPFCGLSQTLTVDRALDIFERRTDSSYVFGTMRGVGFVSGVTSKGDWLSISTGKDTSRFSEQLYVHPGQDFIELQTIREEEYLQWGARLQALGFSVVKTFEEKGGQFTTYHKGMVHAMHSKSKSKRGDYYYRLFIQLKP